MTRPCYLILITISIFQLFWNGDAQFRHKYNVLVRCSHGEVEGFSIPSHYSAYDKQRINVFLGIPYAKRISQYSDWRRQFRFNVSFEWNFSQFFISLERLRNHHIVDISLNHMWVVKLKGKADNVADKAQVPLTSFPALYRYCVCSQGSLVYYIVRAERETVVSAYFFIRYNIFMLTP